MHFNLICEFLCGIYEQTNKHTNMYRQTDKQTHKQTDPSAQLKMLHGGIKELRDPTSLSLSVALEGSFFVDMVAFVGRYGPP